MMRAELNANSFKKWEPAIADLESSLALDAKQPQVRGLLAEYCNSLAWNLTKKFPSRAALDRALKLSARAVELTPGREIFLNTQGVVLYRLGRFVEAVTCLEKSLAAGGGKFDGFDLFFLSMAHYHLGHNEQARECRDRAVHWVEQQKNLAPDHAKELADFRAEAEAVLAGPTGELPDDVFHRPKSGDRTSAP
jgi:tetratricopeptide (TPR) repeat protein